MDVSGVNTDLCYVVTKLDEMSDVLSRIVQMDNKSSTEGMNDILTHIRSCLKSIADDSLKKHAKQINESLNKLGVQYTK